MNNYTVYMHISPSGKRYIGITCQKPEYRWGRNGNKYKQNIHFTNAINKYGWDNFQHIIIARGLTEEEAKWLEIELIREWNSVNKEYGYNISLGGESGNHSEETRKKISEGNKGKIVSEESRKKISEGNKGKIVSDETKKKMSESKKGENNPSYGKIVSEESRKKMSESKKGENNPMYGKNHSEETKKKMSETLKGENNPNYGKSRSEETRKKMSEVRKRKGLSKGKNNPMYGKGDLLKGKNNFNAKAVICITTKAVFYTVTEGSIFYNIKGVSGIIACCKGKLKSCGKYNGTKLVWRYIEIIEL